jgi:hypothetical protein
MNQGLSDWFLGNTCLLTSFTAGLSASYTLDFLSGDQNPLLFPESVGNSLETLLKVLCLWAQNECVK